MSILILKADGTSEEFDRNKLLASLIKAGASEDIAERITANTEKSLHENMRTADIYRSAFTLLRKHEPHGTAARYSLRRALTEFGPSGFPFEQYLAEVFRTEGYEATTNVIAQGKCVDHEIDVLLKKNGVNTYVEAKFHNTPGFKTDLKVALYVQARIEDLQAKDPSARGMLITNTKLTSKAFSYASCVGLEVITWEYPKNHNLQYLIERSHLYPVTALASLSKKEKNALIAENIVLCNAVPRQAEILKGLGISGTRMRSLFDEVGALCG